MAVELADAYVSIVPSARGVGSGIARELLPDLERAGDEGGNRAVAGFGRRFTAGIRTVALAAGGLLVVGVGAAFKMGESFDEAFDTIRIGTGATGDALEALQEDFRQVARNTPATFDQVGTAIADLNTRLGLTGEELQIRSRQFLELSRITGTEVAPNIESITRMFGDWAIETDQQTDTMNALFRASQATGAGIDQLSRQAVQFGAPMRQLGFSFEESISLLGQFEKEGVNTELVMGSMRQALGRMAREGEPAIETFQRVTEEIANAGSASEANAIALELFGARAGPDMAAAIREGRFEIEDLYNTVAYGQETIIGAAEDTADFGESWQILKNQVFLALEPIVTRVFSAISDGMADIIPVVEEVVAAFDENGFTGVLDLIEEKIPAVEGVLSNLRTALAAVYDYVRDNEWVLKGAIAVIGVGLVGAFVSWAVAAGLAAIATFLAILPFALLAAGIAIAVALFVKAYNESETFRNIIHNYLIPALETFGKIVLLYVLPPLRDLRDVFLAIVRNIDKAVDAFNRFKNTASSGLKMGFNPYTWVAGGITRLFHDGGVVPGRPGEEVPAVLMAGETVLPTHDPSWVSGNMLDLQAGGGAVDLYIHGADSDLLRMFQKMVRVRGGNVQAVLGGAR